MNAAKRLVLILCVCSFWMISLWSDNIDSACKEVKRSSLVRLTQKIYYLPDDQRTDRPLLAVISGSKASLVIDGGASPSHASLFLSKIKDNHEIKPQYLVITHWHWDHVFGIDTMNLTTIAHHLTHEKLKWMRDLRWDDDSLNRRVKEGTEIEFCRSMMKMEMPDRSDLIIGLPDIIYWRHLQIDLGGISCKVENIGGDHSPDSTIVFVEGENVLFLGDCLYPDFYSGEPSYKASRLFPLLHRLLDFSASIYVDSHQAPLTLEQMKKRCQQLKALGEFVGIQKNLTKIMVRFEKFHKREATEREAWILSCFVSGNKKS